MRRFKEIQAKGSTDTYEKVLEDVNKRDYNDMNRAVTPLRQAEDAVLIDSTDMTIDEVVEFIISRIK